MNMLTVFLFAQVTTVSAQGFVSEHTMELENVTPHEAYVALTRDVGRWWDAAHSYSGDRRNFYIEPRAGGCFCERLASGGSVMHMQVVFADPGNRLRMSGGLGPLQTEAVSGSMEFAFEAYEGGTRLSYRYAVSGMVSGGLDGWAEAVDRVQLGQLKALRSFLAEE